MTGDYTNLPLDGDTMNDTRNADRRWSEIIFADVDIVDFIQRYEELTQLRNDVWRGAHAHAHDSPSNDRLVVSGQKNIWHCFSCGKAGSAITYEMERIGCDYVTACRNIAQIYGINLVDADHDQISEEERTARDTRRNTDQRIAELMNSAADFYHRKLTPQAREYYNSRGITDETIDELKLGFAGRDKRALFNYLSSLSSNPTREELMATGLFYEENGTLYDSFYSRYILPYWRNGAQVAYFNARDALNLPPRSDGNDRPRYKKQNCSADYVNKRVVEQIVWGAHEILKKPRRPRQREEPEEPEDDTAIAPMPPEMPRIRIMICEGIIDAILARQELSDEFTIISPTTTRITKKDIENIATSLEQVGKCYVVFANDSDANSAGATGALASAKELLHHLRELHKRKAALLAAAAENGDTSVSWFVEMGGEEAYIASRIPHIKIATLPKPPEMESIDIADYVELGIIDHVRYWCHEDTARNIWQYNAYLEGNPNRFFEGKSDGKFLPKIVTDEIRSEEGRYFVSLGARLYDYQNGVYIRDPNEERTKHLIQDKLSIKRQPSIVNNGVDDLIMATYEPIDVFTTEGSDEIKINCKNGVYNLGNDTLDTHTPYHISLSQIKANWNPDAQCPQIDSFLDEFLDEESRKVYWEMLGYCLLPDVRFHQSFIFIGGGHNGKSTALDIARIFLGEENVSAVSLHELEEKPYSSALLYGKMANVCADIPNTHLAKTDKFKNISSGDPVMIEEKFKTAFPAVLHCKLLFSANSMPTTSDRTKAFIRRWVPMMFTKEIPIEDVIPKYAEMITTQDELDGAFVKAVNGLRESLERGKVYIPNQSREFLMEYQEENDVVVEFNNECVNEAEESITNAELFEVFKRYCEVCNRQAVGKIKFLRRFRELYPGQEELMSGNRKGFQGISVSLDAIEVDEYGMSPGNSLHNDTPGFE